MIFYWKKYHNKEIPFIHQRKNMNRYIEVYTQRDDKRFAQIGRDWANSEAYIGDNSLAREIISRNAKIELQEDRFFFKDKTIKLIELP